MIGILLAGLTVPLLEAGDGVKVSPPVVIARGDAPAGATDRLGALAVWRDHGCIELARLAADATAGKPIELGCGASGAPRAVSNGDVTLVVWPAGELAGALVTPELHVTALHVKTEHPVTVTAAYDGARFLVATASCTAADLVVFDHAGTTRARTVLKTAKPHDDLFVSGAVVGCERDHCEAAYTMASTTNGIAGGCEEQIKKPRWAALYRAPVSAGVPGTFGMLDPTAREGPTYPSTTLIARHGLAWALGGFEQRHDSALGAFGSLTTTTTYESDRSNGHETLTPDHVEIEFVPTDPHAAHHAPLATPGETSPEAIALGGDRFVLLTIARDGVVARAIAITPAWFTHPPPPRGPVLTGRVRTSNQKPPPMPPAMLAGVGCLTHDGHCGDSVLHEDGTFVVTPSDPLDHRVAARADDPAIIAYGSIDEYWFTPAQHARTADIQLVAAAHLTGTVVWPNGKRPDARPMPAQFVNDGPRGKRRLPDEDPLELTFQAYGIVPVSAPYGALTVPSLYSYPLKADGTFDVPVAATGQALLVAETRNHEWGATLWTKTEPGKTIRIDLLLKPTATLTVRMKGVPWGIGDQDDMRLVGGICSADGRGCTFEHIAAGPQLLGVTTPTWTMVRRLDIAPGETKTLELPPVADLAPGDPGIQVARAIDGTTITSVAPGGPATGLLAADDVITAIDGVATGTDLAAAIAKLRGAPGSRVELTLTRARTSLKRTITRTQGTSTLQFTVVSR